MELTPQKEKKKWSPLRRQRSRKANTAEQGNLEESDQNVSGASPYKKNGGIGMFGRSRRMKVVVSQSKTKSHALNTTKTNFADTGTASSATGTEQERKPTQEKTEIALAKVLSAQQDSVTTDPVDSSTDHSSSTRDTNFKILGDPAAEVYNPRGEEELRTVAQMDAWTSHVPEISDDIVSETTASKAGTQAKRLIDRVRESRDEEYDSSQTPSFLPLTPAEVFVVEGIQACSKIDERTLKQDKDDEQVFGIKGPPVLKRNLFDEASKIDGWQTSDDLSSAYIWHTRSCGMLQNGRNPMDRATCLTELANLKKQLEDEEQRIKEKLVKECPHQIVGHSVNKEAMSNEGFEANIDSESLMSPTTFNVSYGRSRTSPAPVLYYEKFFAVKPFSTRNIGIGTAEPSGMRSAPSDEGMEQDVNVMLANGESLSRLGAGSNGDVDKYNATFYNSDTEPFYGVEEAKKVAHAIALKNAQRDVDKRNSNSSVASHPTPSHRSNRILIPGKSFFQKLRKTVEKKKRQNENEAVDSLDNLTALAKKTLNKMAAARVSGSARKGDNNKNKSQISDSKGRRQVFKKMPSKQCSTKKKMMVAEGAERPADLSGVELDKSSTSDLLNNISIVEEIQNLTSISEDDDDDDGSFSDGDSISDCTDYCSYDDTYSGGDSFEKAEIPRLLSSMAESIHRTVSWSTGIDLDLEPSKGLLSEFSEELSDNEEEDMVLSRSSSFASSKDSFSCNNMYDFRRFTCM